MVTGAPRGRPPKDPAKLAIWLARIEAAKSGHPVAVATKVPVVQISEKEMLQMIDERFDTLRQIVQSAATGGVRSVIISGAGGVGKSYQVESIVEAAKEEYGINPTIIHGVLSPVSLYKLLYENRTDNDVVVLDDADGIFQDDKALTVLKAALDTNKVRKISWISESHALQGIPNTFEYCGTMIFITNLPLHQIAERGGHKNATHLQALITRALYLDLKLHQPNQLLAWIKHIVTKANILVAEHGLSKAQQNEVLAYITENADNLRGLSIRTAIQIAGFMKSEEDTGNDWRKLANICLKK